MALTVDSILPQLTADQIKALLLGYLRNARLPTTDWHSGAFIRTLMDVHGVAALQSVGRAKPAIVKNGFPEEATEDGLTNVAQQLFSIRRNFDLTGTQFAGTATQQAVTLSATGFGPYTVTGGSSFWVRSPITGNRYHAITSGTIPANGSVIVTFEAEHPNDSANGSNYADGPGTLTILEPAFPGTSATNAAPTFSGVSSTAVGLGVVTVSGAAAPSPTAYDIVIVVSGQVGAATFHYRANGGTFSATQTTASSFTIPAGPTIHFANDGGGSDPSFVVGDLYSFTSPGTPITRQGLDPESDSDLLARCFARWPDLAIAPTVDKHVTWGLAADPAITRVRVDKDLGYPGRLLITVAGTTNPLNGTIVDAAQLYIDQREQIGDLSLVSAAIVVTVTARATVAVPLLRLASIQEDASQQWTAYVNSADVGGTIRISRFEQIVMDLGAIDISGLTINTFATNLVLSSNHVGSADDIISANVTWIGV